MTSMSLNCKPQEGYFIEEVAQVAELLKKLFPIDLQLFAADDSQDEESTDEQEETEEKEEQKFDEDYVKKLRTEAAKHRTEKKKAEDQLSKVLKALGVGDEADPDKLKDQISQKDKRIRSLAIENAFGKVASKLGADPELTMAVLHRKGALDALDVDGEGFTAALEAEVKAALEANPKLKATDPAKTGDSGSDKNPDGSKVSMNDLIRRAAGLKK